MENVTGLVKGGRKYQNVSSLVFLLCRISRALDQYLSNFPHQFHHYCLTLRVEQIYIMTIMKDLISNRKVNVKEMSKIELKDIPIL